MDRESSKKGDQAPLTGTHAPGTAELATAGRGWRKGTARRREQAAGAPGILCRKT